VIKTVIFSFQGLLFISFNCALCGIYVGVICSCFFFPYAFLRFQHFMHLLHILSVGFLNDSTQLLLLSYMQSVNGICLKAIRYTYYCPTTINLPSVTIPKWVNIINHSLSMLLFMKEEKKDAYVIL